MLTSAFFSLTSYAQNAILRALGPDSTRSFVADVTPPQTQASGGPYSVDNNLLDNQSLQELDLLLPKVCEALVLVTQGLVSLALFSEESLNPPASPVRRDEPPSLRPDQSHLKDDMSRAISPRGVGFIEALTGRLQSDA